MCYPRQRMLQRHFVSPVGSLEGLTPEGLHLYLTAPRSRLREQGRACLRRQELVILLQQ